VKKLAQKRASVSRNRKKPMKFTIAYLAGEKTNLAVYQRDELPAGARLRTPCIVTEYSSTTLVPAGARCKVDAYSNLLIQVS
jgi:N-methylhydantoinase A